MTRPARRRADRSRPADVAPPGSGGTSSRARGLARALSSIPLLALLAACAGGPVQPEGVPVAQETARYQARARSYYAPPGPPDDPWGPYITEASRRFDVPDPWIRAVIGRESGGRQFGRDGTLTTSPVGAMGLMQLMAPTYDDLRAQYRLGDDAFEPHDNIMAGTAYVRQMYDIYGAPGFLAAYNTGPGRLDDFLTRNRPLPRETRQYVAIIGPQIAGIWPNSRSQADLLVASHAGSPDTDYASAQSGDQTRSVRDAWTRRRDGTAAPDQPVQVAEAPAAGAAPAPAYTRAWDRLAANQPAADATDPATDAQSVRAAWAGRVMPAAPPPARPPVQVARAAPEPEAARIVRAGQGNGSAASAVPGRAWDAAPTPMQLMEPVPAPAPQRARAAAPPPAQVAAVEPQAPERRLRFHLIRPAMAEPAPLLRDAGRDAPRTWSIQVGAFVTPAQASEAAGAALSRAPGLSHARTEVAGVRQGRSARLYRARLTGLSRTDALQACERLSRNRNECMVVSPDARS